MIRAVLWFLNTKNLFSNLLQYCVNYDRIWIPRCSSCCLVPASSPALLKKRQTTKRQASGDRVTEDVLLCALPNEVTDERLQADPNTTRIRRTFGDVSPRRRRIFTSLRSTKEFHSVHGINLRTDRDHGTLREKDPLHLNWLHSLYSALPFLFLFWFSREVRARIE